VTGSAWNLTLSSITHGLYMRYAIATDNGGRVYWRGKDGIYVSQMGGPEASVTEDIFNLFPHEGLTLAPVTVAGYTVYPPDDTKPGKQTLAYAKVYLYYDYQDTNGNPRTLVYDVEGKGWSVDVYGSPATVHYWEEGVVNDVLTGSWNGTQAAVQPLGSAVAESVSCVVMTPSINGGDPRVQKIIGDMFVRSVLQPGDSIALSAYGRRYSDQITGFNPASLTGGDGTSRDFLIDFTGATNNTVEDFGAIFTWPVGSLSILDYWQVDWSATPEQIGGWKTDLTGYGAESGGALHGWLHVGYFNLAYASTAPVTVTAQTDTGQTITMTFPSTNGTLRKQYQIVPANKFKLIGWTVDGGGNGFRLDASDCEMAIKAWGETGPYHILRPFAGQSPQQGTQV